MRIAITFDRPIPALRYGGSDRVVWSLGKCLTRHGHEVVFVVPRGSSCDFAEVIPHDSDSPAQDLIGNVDLVHDFMGLTGFRTPSLFTLQGNAPPGTRFSRNTVFISHNHAKRHGGSVVVYNSIDPEEYGPLDWSVARESLLFLANASWRVKNVRGAIRIAHRAGRPLDVIGGHRVSFNMGFRVTLDPNARFHGVIGGEKKHRIINRSSALLFPVRWHEPFGIAMVEALYFGCPVFGTTYGSLPEVVVPEVGTLADSESALSDAAAEVSRFDRRFCHEYALDNFSADLMTRRYLELYQRVLDGEELHAEEPVATEEATTGLLPMGD